jgi:hypothetical protein
MKLFYRLKRIMILRPLIYLHDKIHSKGKIKLPNGLVTVDRKWFCKVCNKEEPCGENHIGAYSKTHDCYSLKRDSCHANCKLVGCKCEYEPKEYCKLLRLIWKLQ